MSYKSSDRVVSSCYAHGKLLLTGEYYVLNGALSLALPTKLGQSLNVFTHDDGGIIHWISKDNNQQVWFSAAFDCRSLDPISYTDEKVAKQLSDIFKAIKLLKSYANLNFKGLQFETHLEFPLQWGLGSSSTLIALLASFYSCNPYQLLDLTMRGSGYDIACAFAKKPILYQRIADQVDQPIVKPINFSPSFQDQLLLVYLEQKQNSRQSIAQFKKLSDEVLIKKNVALISNITEEMLLCDDMKVFEKLISVHENIISTSLNIERCKNKLFPDYRGEVKSLGGWGGDFVLATCPDGVEEAALYFEKKGFRTTIKYDDIILGS
ncbi:MAG: hypothetical protein KA010_00420 [Saprospiraceae bacterium]|nr:hypothetical protein [Saprospiraceae bacterium]